MHFAQPFQKDLLDFLGQKYIFLFPCLKAGAQN